MGTIEGNSNQEGREWHVEVEGKQKGPLTFAEIHELAAQGKINTSSLAWKKGIPDWQPISQIAELSGLTIKPVPPNQAAQDAPPPLPKVANVVQTPVNAKASTVIRKPLKVVLIVLLVFMGVLLAFGIIDSLINPDSSVSSTVSQQATVKKFAKAEPLPTPSVKAKGEQLWAEYSSNRIAADQKYNGKNIGISGSVSRVMKSGTTISVFLTGSNEIIGGGVICCEFPESENNKIAGLKDGDVVEMIGKCVGRTYFGFVEGVRITDCRLVSGGSATSTSTKSVPKVISAVQVAAQFRDNQVAAEAQFLKKTFIVTGVVKQVDKAMLGSMYVLLGASEQHSDVYCYFEESQASALAKITQGQMLGIQGICDSWDTGLMGVGSLRFKQCKIIPDAQLQSMNTADSKTEAAVTPAVENKGTPAVAERVDNISNETASTNSQQVSPRAPDKQSAQGQPINAMAGGNPEQVAKNWLKANRPQCVLLSSEDYQPMYQAGILEANAIPWFVKGNFDGDTKLDCAFLTKDSNTNEIGLFFLNGTGYSQSESSVMKLGEGYACLDVKTFGNSGLAGLDKAKEKIQIDGTSPCIFLGAVASEYFGYFCWKDGKYVEITE